MTTITQPYYYDQAAAQRPEEFFESVLVYPTSGVFNKGGDAFLLQPFQKDFLRSCFGWYKTSDESGKPAIKHKFNYLEVPKGQGKTPLMAGIAILVCGFSGVNDGEIYLLAATRKQAKKMLEDCKIMIRGAGLASRFNLRQHVIIHKKSGTFISAESSEAGASEGVRPDLVILDEAHIQPNDVLYNTFAAGMGKKFNTSQFFTITTAGEINTFGHKLHKRAKNIQDEIVKDDSWNVKIYGAPPGTTDEDCLKIETARACNPGLGTIKSEENLKEFIVTASTDNGALNAYKRYHLNIWVNSLVEWCPLDTFKKCNKNIVDLEYHRKNQTPCFAGLDLASTEDMSALSLLFIEENEDGTIKNVDWVKYCWIPVDLVHKKEKTEHLNYPEWVKKDLVFTCPGDVQDKDQIFDFVEEQNVIYNMKICNVDTAFHRAVLAAKAETSAVNWQPHGQSAPIMSTPTKELRIWIGKELINYGGDPVMEWQLTNCEAWTDSNENVKLMKGTGRGKGSGKAKKKIDIIISGVMAVSGYLSKPDIEKGVAVAWW